MDYKIIIVLVWIALGLISYFIMLIKYNYFKDFPLSQKCMAPLIYIIYGAWSFIKMLIYYRGMEKRYKNRRGGVSQNGMFY